jgi:glucose-induced degradation protein 8
MITRDEWERKLKEVKIRKEDMNRLIMNFLVTEGYVDAAQKFHLESGTKRIRSPSFVIVLITDFLYWDNFKYAPVISEKKNE